MDGQLAKPSAERLVLVKVQFLVPEEQHLMLHQRVVNFLERLVAQFLPEIDTVISAPMVGVTGRTSIFASRIFLVLFP